MISKKLEELFVKWQNEPSASTNTSEPRRLLPYGKLSYNILDKKDIDKAH